MVVAQWSLCTKKRSVKQSFIHVWPPLFTNFHQESSTPQRFMFICLGLQGPLVLPWVYPSYRKNFCSYHNFFSFQTNFFPQFLILRHPVSPQSSPPSSPHPHCLTNFQDKDSISWTFQKQLVLVSPFFLISTHP